LHGVCCVFPDASACPFRPPSTLSCNADDVRTARGGCTAGRMRAPVQEMTRRLRDMSLSPWWGLMRWPNTLRRHERHLLL
jgi:hypothetical protein